MDRHGAIYKVRPDVKSVVHAHTASVIPFGVSSTRLMRGHGMVAVGTSIPEAVFRAALVDRSWQLWKRAIAQP